MRLLAIEAAVFRGTAPNGLVVFVRTNDSVEVLVVGCRPLEILSEPPLFLQVPQRDISPLSVSGVTSWVGTVRVMSGEPVLRGVSEQLFSKSDQALPPTLGIVQLLCEGELLRLVGSLFSGSSPPTQEDDQEDESASEGHEKNLPPLKSVRIDLGGSGSVDAGDGGQWWYRCCSRGLWDHDQIGKTNT